MIKYFLIFLNFSLTLLALDDAPTKVELNETTNYNVPKPSDPISLSAQKSELSITVTEDDKIVTVNKKIKTPDDIKVFTSKVIEPINYTNSISLNKLQVSEKKLKFFYMILPAILISKTNLRLKRERVLTLIDTPQEAWSEDDYEFIEDLYKKYQTNNIKKLANRLKTHPVSIVLAQAAIESAWGESRFFKKGNNIFGMWSYNRHEPRMRSKGTRNGKHIYVKKYASVSDAIDDYFMVIGRGAYKSFRKQRNITDNPLQLVKYLVNYCELNNYPNKLRKFIVHNKLRKFDKFRLSSNY